MFATFAEELEQCASREAPGLSAAFFNAFPIIKTDAETDLSGSPDLDENGILSLLNSTLTANKMLAENLAATFGMSSIHSVSVTP